MPFGRYRFPAILYMREHQNPLKNITESEYDDIIDTICNAFNSAELLKISKNIIFLDPIALKANLINNPSFSDNCISTHPYYGEVISSID